MRVDDDEMVECSCMQLCSVLVQSPVQAACVACLMESNLRVMLCYAVAGVLQCSRGRRSVGFRGEREREYTTSYTPQQYTLYALP